jgi:TetR/AcrR family transcriptional regulator, transcriptional repressor for nem operon
MRTQKKLTSPERILKAAIKLFVKKGYNATSVAEIMKAAGLTRGALYCHFETKEHLAREIIRLFEEKFLKNMVAFVEENGGSPLTRIENMIRFDIRFAGENPELCLFMTLVSAEMCGAGNRLESHLKSFYKKWRDFVANILEEGKRVGELNDNINPSMLALIIMGAHDGVLLHLKMNRDITDLSTYTRHFKDLIVSGVRGTGNRTITARSAT